MPKATAVFDADDSRLSGALARVGGPEEYCGREFADFPAGSMGEAF